MATTETEVTVDAQAATAAKRVVKVRPKKSDSILDKVLGLLSSVRFGIIMLTILLICCIIGMLVMQQDVDGFRGYYMRLTPSQRFIFGKLGFFHIYHSSYFSLLLAITGLNIILASIDRFPTAWQYIVKPKLAATPNFIRAQMFNKEVRIGDSPREFAEKARSAWRRRGMRARITEEKGRITVFAQRHAWNRIGAYFVHVALLTVFTGGFLTNRYGLGGLMEIAPGKSGDTFQTQEIQPEGEKIGTARLPFVIECTDIQQRLIRPEGGLEPSNTVDWLSYIKIKDGPTEQPALVHLNEPFDYRGYRFFQLKFESRGYAREITVSFEPVGAGAPREVSIRRNESVDVDGIGRVSYVNFYPDFAIEDGKPSTASGDYNNPVAELRVTSSEGKTRGAFAFGSELADKFYSGLDQQGREALLVNGSRVLLKTFEKVPTSHTLAVQYDPGRKPVYFGFTILIIALCSVFFFAHQRIWAVIEPAGQGARGYFGGNTNRNRAAFEGRFNELVESATTKKEARNEHSN